MEKQRSRDNFFRSFRGKLLLLVLLSSIPALSLAVHRSLEQRSVERARVVEMMTALGRLIASTESAHVNNARQLLATLAEFSFLVRSTDSEFTRVHLANLLKLSPDYLNFGLIDSDGTLFASSVTAAGEDIYLGDRSYFQRSLKSGRFSVGDYQMGRLTGEPGVNFGYPIWNEKGEIQRILFASLKLDLLTETAGRVALPAGTSVTILDRKGTVLTRLPEIPELVGKSAVEAEFVQQVLKTQKGTVECIGLDGMNRFYAVSTVSDGAGPCYYIAVGTPTAVLFSEVNRAMLRNLIILVVVTLLALVIAYKFADRTFVRPVKQLVSAANQVASADLTARAPEFKHTAELHELSEAFNRMTASLQARDAELSQAHEQIKGLNADLEEKVQERTAQLTAANKELEAFSYSVSHDLRAPLRHMDGFAQLLKKHQSERLDEKGKRHLEVISEAARKMGTLIDELLVFSRMGRQELLKTPLNMDTLVREISAELSQEEPERRVEWVFGDLPEVRADPAMMRQVWVNLISNALKYSKPREITRIEIKSERQDGELVFSVTDNGVGFDMRYSDKLFGVFQRLHSDAEFQGTGVGLANVRRIVTRHDGKTWAESEPGTGSTFYFSLPVK